MGHAFGSPGFVNSETIFFEIGRPQAINQVNSRSPRLAPPRALLSPRLWSAQLLPRDRRRRADCPRVFTFR
jgi:hypothetical protein